MYKTNDNLTGKKIWACLQRCDVKGCHTCVEGNTRRCKKCDSGMFPFKGMCAPCAKDCRECNSRIDCTICSMGT